MLATSADSNLGGRDFDRLLATHFANEFKTRYKVKSNSFHMYWHSQKCNSRAWVQDENCMTLNHWDSNWCCFTWIVWIMYCIVDSTIFDHHSMYVYSSHRLMQLPISVLGWDYVQKWKNLKSRCLPTQQTSPLILNASWMIKMSVLSVAGELEVDHWCGVYILFFHKYDLVFWSYFIALSKYIHTLKKFMSLPWLFYLFVCFFQSHSWGDVRWVVSACRDDIATMPVWLWSQTGWHSLCWDCGWVNTCPCHQEFDWKDISQVSLHHTKSGWGSGSWVCHPVCYVVPSLQGESLLWKQWCKFTVYQWMIVRDLMVLNVSVHNVVSRWKIFCLI